MLVSTEGIVLSAIKYNDNSLIVKVFTRLHGLLSMMVSGVYGRKSSMKVSAFQVLNIDEIVYYYHENRELHRIKEARCHPVLYSIAENVVKSSLAVFIAEVLGFSIKGIQTDEEIYLFVKETILNLDAEEDPKQLTLFPHRFLLEWSTVLGFGPSDNNNGKYFYLQNGNFSDLNFESQLHMDVAESSFLRFLLLHEMDQIPTNAALRLSVLKQLVRYFEVHINGFGKLRSLDVLHEVLHGAKRSD